MQRPGSSCRMVCDANERTVGLVGVNTHDQQVRPLRQCRDRNPPRRNQGCIRPVSCPPVRRGWCLGPGRVSNNDLPPAFGAAPQPAGDRCHQGNARRSTLAEQIRPPTRPKHSATEGHVTVTARPNRCHTLSRPLQCVYCRINLYGNRVGGGVAPLGRPTGTTTLRAALTGRARSRFRSVGQRQSEPRCCRHARTEAATTLLFRVPGSVRSTRSPPVDHFHRRAGASTANLRGTPSPYRTVATDHYANAFGEPRTPPARRLSQPCIGPGGGLVTGIRIPSGRSPMRSPSLIVPFVPYRVVVPRATTSKRPGAYDTAPGPEASSPPTLSHSLQPAIVVPHL
jgi:hypothetical protein